MKFGDVVGSEGKCVCGIRVCKRSWDTNEVGGRRFGCRVYVKIRVFEISVLVVVMKTVGGLG